MTDSGRMGRDIEAICEHVRGFYAPALAVRDHLRGKVKVVRYEVVAQDPETAIPPLAEFAGVPVEAASVDDMEAWNAGSPFMDAATRTRDAIGASFWSPLYHEPVTDARVGRYREALSADEVSRVEAGLADFNRVFRYW